MTDSSLSPKADHIVLIGIDGMGGYYINQKLEDGTLTLLCPTFDAILRGRLEGFVTGLATTNAKTVHPSVSAPAWASILTGMTPDQTGIETKFWPSDAVDPVTQIPLQLPPEVPSKECPQVPCTVFDLIPSDRSIRHLSYVSWDWLGSAISSKLPTAVETKFWPGADRRLPDGTMRSADEDVCREFVAKFTGASVSSLPKFSFLHFDDVDHYGHKYGWGSDEYYASWTANDAMLSRVLEAVKDKSALVVIIADHGGSENDHGKIISSHMLIPLIFATTASSPRLEALTSFAANARFDPASGVSLSDSSTTRISCIDVVPTLLELEGVKGHDGLRGRPLLRFSSL